MTTTLIRTDTPPEALIRLRERCGHAAVIVADGVRGRSPSCGIYKRYRPMSVTTWQPPHGARHTWPGR